MLPFIYHLYWFAFFYFDPRTQDLVSSDDLIDHSLQRIKVEFPLQPHRSQDVIERIVRRELIQKPQPLLRERQRQPSLTGNAHQSRRLHLSTDLQRLLQALRQFTYRRALEQRPERQLDTERGAHSRDGLRRK